MAKGAAILHIEVQITPQYMQAGRVSDLSHGWKGRHTVFFALTNFWCQADPPWAQKIRRATIPLISGRRHNSKVSSEAISLGPLGPRDDGRFGSVFVVSVWAGVQEPPY